MRLVWRRAKVLAAIGLAAATAAAALAVGSAPGGAQATQPQATASPATGLVDGSRVTVSVTGLPAGQAAAVAQCPVGAGLDFARCKFTGNQAGADASGNVSFEVGVDAILADSDSDNPEDLDCRPDACELLVFSGFGDSEAFPPIEVPIGFTADGPLAPPPTVTVDPDEGLVDGQVVTVSAAGLVWEDDGFALLCKADLTSSSDCSFDALGFFTVAADRTATVQLRMTTFIETGSGVVDCREPGACAVVVTTDSGRSPRKLGIAPVAFDPDAEVVPPALSITPSTDLVDGQSVTANGSGFTSDFVELVECMPGATDFSDCEFVGFVEGTNPDGTFSQTVTLAAVLTGEGGSGSVDCRTSSEPCVLVATSNSIDSPRAARVPLAFRPDGPLLPGPSVTVTPSTDLPDQATVTVTGSGFPEQGSGSVMVCGTGGGCDPETQTQVEADNAGTISLQLGVAATFTPGEGAPVDCRAAPGCEVVAISFDDFGHARRGSAPITFAPSTGTGQTRYLDPVFSDVDVTENVAYRTTTTAAGQPVTLTLDIYQPKGDTAAHRPLLVWLPGGWFDAPDQDVAATYAEAFARRGYVVAVMDYRQRPGLCCPSGDATGLTAAFLDAHQDAVAGVAWLRDHADQYKIDTRAIAAAGSEAGAATALHLADLPGQMGVGGTPAVAAAVGIGGVDLGRHDAGEMPTLALNSTNNIPAPQFLAQWACDHSRRVGVVCETVGYDGIFGDVAALRQRDATRRTSRFLVDAVLAPLGLAAPTGDSFTPVASPSTPAATPGTPAATAAAAPAAQTQGNLPRTGMSATATLVLVGLVLAALGAVLVALGRARRRGRTGRLGLTGAVAVGVGAVLLTSLIATGCSKGGDDTNTSEQTDEHDMNAPGHDMDDDSGDHAETGDDEGHDHASGDEMDDHGDDESAAGAPDSHGHGDTTGSGTGTGHTGTGHTGGTGGSHHSSGSGGGSTHGNGDSHANPGDPSHANPGDPSHGNPGDPSHANPGDPSHANPGDPGHEHPTEPMPTGFDPNWTPDQTAFAQSLIDRTTAAMPQFANPAILPLMNYSYIFDGTTPGTYQHWINTGLLGDSHTLDPQVPESLVFRNTGDLPVLEAAMYMLGLGADMNHLPADSAFLPGWHTHNNLCFDDNFHLVGVTVNGVCLRGHFLPTPPMLHIWIVDTPCGRFAGVDENGLQCEPHQHEG
ncbi:MAG TPA: neocarzinostatin apoprotein domain-containing protein [Acidimicrobiales bacterium]